MTITEEAAKQLMEFIKSAADFAVGQAPDVAREILAYKAVSLTWGMYLGLVGFGLGVFVFGLGVFIAGKIKSSYNDEWLAPVLIGLAFICVGGLSATASKLALIKIQIAPKMFLLEYLGHLVAHGG